MCTNLQKQDTLCSANQDGNGKGIYDTKASADNGLRRPLNAEADRGTNALCLDPGNSPVMCSTTLGADTWRIVTAGTGGGMSRVPVKAEDLARAIIACWGGG